MTTYTLEAKENLSADLIALVDAEILAVDQTLNLATSQFDIGVSYDRLNRTLVYSACLVNPLSGTPTNGTGSGLWSGVHQISDGATYDEYNDRNFSILTRTLDSETVTRFDCYSSTSLVPNGIGPSDGTWHRFVEASYNDAQVIKLVDPRTRNVWSHHTSGAGLRSCLIYEFRFSEDYKQTISPYVPSADRHLELMGITEKWAYVGDIGKDTAGRYTLELLPRVRTAEEVTADYLLSDGGFELPSGTGADYEEGVTFIRAADSSLWFFSCNVFSTNARQYHLYKFTQPSSAPGDPIVGGGWADVTPWAAGTGPNLGAADYRGDVGSNSKNIPIPLPATNGAALLTILFAGSLYPTPSNDPNDFAIDCTYIDLVGGFDYHPAFVTGYMTAAWETTTDPMAAAWAVWGVWQTDGDLAYHDYEFPGVDYAKRWFFFGVSPVVAGVSTPTYAGSSPLSAPHVIMVEYHFVSGAAPVVSRIHDEVAWDALYTTYATAISNANVICGSMLTSFVQGTGRPDIGLWDDTGSAWWWSGQRNNFWQLDAAFTPRSDYLEEPPLMRIGFGVTPPAFARRAHMWSLIGAPQLRSRASHIVPPASVPVNTVAPVITGTTEVGSTLALSDGSWTQSPFSFSKVWLRGVTVIPGETGDTYVLTEADDGFLIGGQVIATNGAGPSAPESATAVGPVTAAPTEVPVNTSLPVISGPIVVGGTLSATTGGWTNSPTGYTRRWLLNSSAITGATGSTYLLTGADEGGDITHEVIASNGAGPSAPATSDPVGPIAPAPAIPVLGPAATWDGTAGSGNAPPSGDYTRVKTDPPMAINRIATCPGQRVAGQILLKIPADAYGGIAEVEISGDCETATVTTMANLTFVDVNGVSHPEFYYAVYLDAAAFVAQAGVAGERVANVYSKVTPVSGSVSPRVQSWVFYPEATETDGTYTVGVGKTYSTIRAALEAAKNDAKKAPLIEIWTTANYEMQDSTWGIYTGGHGFAVITARPGITATIQRASAFSPTNEASWTWTPGWDGIEFRGSGIVIDYKNMTTIVMDTKPCLVNGAVITNSVVGGRDSLYWNKSPHPGFSFSTPSWWQYHSFAHGAAPTDYQLAVIGSTSDDTFGDIYSHTPIVYGPTDTNSSSLWFRTQISALTVRYSGSGSATLAKTGGNGSGSLVAVDPAGTLSIPLGAINDLVEIQAVADLLNARSGWTATVHDTTRAARFLIGDGFGDANGFPPTNAKAADLELVTFLDIHSDGTQTYGGVQNFVYWNWQVYGDVDLSAWLFLDGQGSTDGNLDLSFVNDICIGTAGAIGPGGPGCYHNLFRHLTTTCWFSPQAGTQDLYTQATNCIVAGIGTGGDPTAGPAFQFRDNFHTVPNGAQMYIGPTYVDNISLGNAAVVSPADYLTDPTNGDFTPTGVVHSTQFAIAFPYDQRGVERDASDLAGAWSQNP